MPKRYPIEVMCVFDNIWVANYLHYSVIGNSFADAFKACCKEAGLPL